MSFPFVRVTDAKGTPIELQDPNGQLQKKAFGKNKRQDRLLQICPKNDPPEGLKQQGGRLLCH